VFPMHPRTRKNISTLGLEDVFAAIPNLIITDPIGYLDFLKLEINARLIITDSGGIQEESTYFGIPCLTLRENTERPVTLTEGTNQLVQMQPDKIIKAVTDSLAGLNREARIPAKWDGKTAGRIVQVLQVWDGWK
jgi:UDP-N-acetylglucosamine 2-epimerase (non-hydrolysing)